MRRTVVSWLVAVGLVLIASIGGVATANATVFGAGAFVRDYLDTLARGDAKSALGIPGVNDGGADDALLTDAVLRTGARLSDISQVSDTESAGIHTVTVRWHAGGQQGESSFEVERDGSRLGLFPAWRFATPPVALVPVTVAGDSRFRVNDVPASTGTAGDADTFALFVPGAYDVDARTRLLSAPAQTLVADTTGDADAVELEVKPTTGFQQRLQKEVDGFLDSCATQKVLQPTGCPFGQVIDDRVSSPPTWTISTYPVIRIGAGDGAGKWQVSPTTGTANLTMDVQALADGTVSPYDEDVEFRVAYDVTVKGDTITITPIDLGDDG
ncbi:hypothetical protein GCM10027515_07450 [Schumannella luteola]|uniref:Uncharacterized protein n=1 Tax=Schumannella luteola TaxID=472059 RepID=A0A852YLN5_9MICO|nr:hypothetical protein [Schumannella luteola]NYG98125.1 hypothetical protein [Schumannella luteola]TPX01845.1 hypothetical protein FJ656_26020 [Schumannella luteola]